MTFGTGSLALALMAAALGSTAIANPWTDNTGAPQEYAAPPPGTPHTTYDIVVNRFGHRVRGSTGTTVFPSTTGHYVAEFPVDVTSCAYVATLGRATRDGGVDETAGFISAQGSSGFTNGVFVETRGFGNRLRNRPFHLLVAC